MELGSAGLKEQPFRTQGRPIVFFAYMGQGIAYEFLRETCKHNSGLGLLQGPPLSGKTTIIRHFAGIEKANRAVAVVNGAGLNTTSLLESVLREFGYEYKFDTVNELLSMLKVFIQQQTAVGRAPLLIIQNIHEVNPSALRVLCELAQVRVREKFALRMVLVSDRAIDYIVRAPAMEFITKRLTGNCHLEPLTMDETSDYLYAKLRHGGCLDPDMVFPGDVCDELYRASGGWPGVIDRLALLALAQAHQCPVGPQHVEHPTIPERTQGGESPLPGGSKVKYAARIPVVRLTHNGEVLKELKFEGSRLLIGRSDHNDICIESSFISRHHALLIRHGSITLLMDLNSANGTYVNSWRVSNKVLVHNDIITIGEHGLKFIDVSARGQTVLDGVGFSETVVMETIKDVGHVLAAENTDILPRQSGDDEPSVESIQN